jgi:hypothetical protein
MAMVVTHIFSPVVLFSLRCPVCSIHRRGQLENSISFDKLDWKRWLALSLLLSFSLLSAFLMEKSNAVVRT